MKWLKNKTLQVLRQWTTSTFLSLVRLSTSEGRCCSDASFPSLVSYHTLFVTRNRSVLQLVLSVQCLYCRLDTGESGLTSRHWDWSFYYPHCVNTPIFVCDKYRGSAFGSKLAECEADWPPHLDYYYYYYYLLLLLLHWYCQLAL